MNRMWIACLCAFTLNQSLFASTQSEAGQASLARARELMLSVMKRIESGDDRGAIELLRPHLLVPKKEFDSLVDNTVDGRAKAKARFGKVLGFRLVKEEKVSDFLIRFTYVEKRTNHMVRWQFVFYRPAAEWKLNSFFWDDNVFALFDPVDAGPRK